MRAKTLVILAAVAVPLPAQIEPDPRQKIPEILEAVSAELLQIDDWLRQSSQTKDAAKGIQRNVGRIEKLLEETSQSQERVVKGIDELLEQAQKLQGDGEGGC